MYAANSQGNSSGPKTQGDNRIAARAKRLSQTHDRGRPATPGVHHMEEEQTDVKSRPGSKEGANRGQPESGSDGQSGTAWNSHKKGQVATAMHSVHVLSHPSNEQPSAWTKLKKRIWQAFESDPRIVIPVMITIVVSTAAFILESHYDSPELDLFWWILETVAVTIFSVEYFARFFSAPNRKAFALAPLNLLDLVAILPYYLGLLMRGIGAEGETGGVAALRSVRLVRIFRVFKFGRYSIGLQIFVGALEESLTSLSILVFMMAIGVVLFSSAIYFAEFGTAEYNESWRGEDGVVDGPFDSIPDAFWWCVVTMTTVGYGDGYPVTTQGQLVAALTMLAGIVILALPISVLGSNFSKMVEAFAMESEALAAEQAANADGIYDEGELRIWLLEKRRKAGNAWPASFSHSAEDLMKRYGGSTHEVIKVLTSEEFGTMKRDFEAAMEDAKDKNPTNDELVQSLQLLISGLKSLDQRLTQVEDVLSAKDVAIGGQLISA